MMLKQIQHFQAVVQENSFTEAASALNAEGVETDIYWIGNKPIGGCIGCYACAKKRNAYSTTK